MLEITTEILKAKANKTLVAKVQQLWQEVSNLTELEGEHVRSPQSYRWNERADHLAIRCVSA